MCEWRGGAVSSCLCDSFSQSVVYRRPEGLNEENCSYVCFIVLDYLASLQRTEGEITLA